MLRVPPSEADGDGFPPAQGPVALVTTVRTSTGCPERPTCCGPSPVLMGVLEAGVDDVPQGIPKRDDYADIAASCERHQLALTCVSSSGLAFRSTRQSRSAELRPCGIDPVDADRVSCS